ncbi:MAG: hypothetical protein A2144_01895 [Chloroflexi bacterium RBG_16_50_9]|nr:MAG: hypothetical protein A2144_01895 [Chloroflexi bacterium RBG_16_50_9]
MKRIAKEVGISEAAIYRHFKSKKEILSLLADYIEKSWVEETAKVTTEGKKPLEILDSVLRGQLSVVEQRRGISFQIIAEIISLGDKKLNERVSHVIDRYITSLKNLLNEAVRFGEVRDDIDIDVAATALFGILQGLVNIWALNNYNFDPQQKYAALWGIFREAIIKR